MRIKLDDLLLIGSDPLNTTAQKLTGAVNELDGKVGSGTLDTTAQDLIGAVNEIKDESDDKTFTITRVETAAAGASLMFPAPTINGGVISYNYDTRIKPTSTVIPIADSGISGKPIKHSSFVVQANNVQGGAATITLAQAISNTEIGILVIN